MASGDTLVVFTSLHNEPPVSIFATLDIRNAHPVLDFDGATDEEAVFTGVLPRHYAGGGHTVYLHVMFSSAITGSSFWQAAIERMDDGTLDLDADSFATAQTITAATVPASSGVEAITNVAVSNGANIDSIAVGQAFRIRIRRDVANDNAAGDAQLLCVELKET